MGGPGPGPGAGLGPGAGPTALIGREPEIRRLETLVGRIASGAGDALLVFRRLGATPWTARADRELRATGITVSTTADSAWPP